MKKYFFILSLALVTNFSFYSLAFAQANSYKAGDKVEVFRNGKWNTGKVLKNEGDFYEVSFYSYYKNYREILPLNRLRNLETPSNENEVQTSQKQDSQQSSPSL